MILQILIDEGLKGNCYTANQFAEAFEGKAGLGGERTIRERLSALATQGYIKYFRNAQDYGLPSIGRSKFGYLCAKGMVVNLPQGDPDPDTGEVPTVTLRVLPTHYKCPLSGAAMPVENRQTKATFVDAVVAEAFRSFHHSQAVLRVLAREANLQTASLARKPKIARPVKLV